MELSDVAGLLTALSLVLGSQGVVAWVQTRRIKSDVGDTGDSTLVEMVEGLNVRMSNLENDVRTLLHNGPQ